MHNYIEWILKRQVVDACPPRENAHIDKFLIAIALSAGRGLFSKGRTKVSFLSAFKNAKYCDKSSSRSILSIN